MFCLQCVLNNGFQDYKFEFDSLEVEGLKLDCSESLKPKNVFDIEVSFDLEGSYRSIFSNKLGYKNLFAHKQEHDCPVDQCMLMNKNCEE